MGSSASKATVTALGSTATFLVPSSLVASWTPNAQPAAQAREASRVAVSTVAATIQALPRTLAVSPQATPSISQEPGTPQFITVTQTELEAPQITPKTEAEAHQVVTVSGTPHVITVSEAPGGIITVTAAAGSSTLVPVANPAAAVSAAAIFGAQAAELAVYSSSSKTSPSAAKATTILEVVSSGSTTMDGVPSLTRQQTKGPFTPQDAILGGIPTTGLDVPVTVVFLIMFLTGAATHFTIHELNGKRGHKFHISDMVFDFCMVRTVTCTMRIVWAFLPANNSIVLASLIFENAGVVVLYAVDILLTQRILRALHPRFGWSKPISVAFLAILVSVVLVVLINIISLSVSFFSLDPKSLKISSSFIIFGASYTFFLGLFPFLVLLPAGIIPGGSVERFGAGPFRFKIFLLIFATSLLAVGRIINLAVATDKHSEESPTPIESKAVFYISGFLLEIIVVALYAVARIDLIFHVPDGSSRPGDYVAGYAPKPDEEGFFQDVNVKICMSISNTDLQSPAATWQETNRENGDEVRPRPYGSGYGRAREPAPARNIGYETASSRSNGFEQQSINSQNACIAVVQQALRDLEINSGIEGQYLDTGDSDVMLYAFKVQRPYSGSPAKSRTSTGNLPPIPVPPRASSFYWSRNPNSERGEEM